MKLHVSRLDIRKTQENWPSGMAFAPALIVPQPVMHPENWIILSAPLLPGAAPEWSFAGRDKYIRIPVFSYLLRSEADLALAYMLQLGLTCAGNLPQRIREFHVVTGSPVDLLYEDDINKAAGLRYWFGMAVVVERDNEHGK